MRKGRIDKSAKGFPHLGGVRGGEIHNVQHVTPHVSRFTFHVSCFTFSDFWFSGESGVM